MARSGGRVREDEIAGQFWLWGVLKEHIYNHRDTDLGLEGKV